MKKIESIFLNLCFLVICILSFSLGADAAQNDSGKYGNITWSITGDTLTISGKGKL